MVWEFEDAVAVSEPQDATQKLDKQRILAAASRQYSMLEEFMLETLALAVSRTAAACRQSPVAASLLAGRRPETTALGARKTCRLAVVKARAALLAETLALATVALGIHAVLPTEMGLLATGAMHHPAVANRTGIEDMASKTRDHHEHTSVRESGTLECFGDVIPRPQRRC